MLFLVTLFSDFNDKWGDFFFFFITPFYLSPVSFSTDSDNGDYEYELSLEMKRQKIQNELMKLEQENMDKREELQVKKEVQTLINILLINIIINYAIINLTRHCFYTAYSL